MDAAEKITEYEFTQDWFSWAPDLLNQITPILPDRSDFLEIGSFEGRGTVWMVENMIRDGGWIDCVDTWEGGEEHSPEVMAGVEARFDRNIAIVREKYFADGKHANNRRVYKNKWPSAEFLGDKMSQTIRLPVREPVTTYNFIYIDGSHRAPDVLTDAVLAWKVLNPNGVMVFDDYGWGNPRDVLHRPKIAVDAFTNIFGEEAQLIHAGYQYAIRKVV